MRSRVGTLPVSSLSPAAADTRVPRLGIPMVLLEPERGPKSSATGKRTPRLYSLEHARHLVQEARAKAGLPKHVTLAACRHGGMTELGDAGLTESQIMSLSAHETPTAARVYVKRTELQRMAQRANDGNLWSAGSPREQTEVKSWNEAVITSWNGRGQMEINH